MFLNSLDSKQAYIDQNNNIIIDLTESIFQKNTAISQLYSVYKVPSIYNMRPDLISYALYGTDQYTEMILKYSLLDNPFAVNKDDIIVSVSLTSIYNSVAELENKTINKNFDLLKNYHKYIDKNKIPSSAGSQKNTIGDTDNTTNTSNSKIEANISSTGKSGVTVENGRIYFGNTPTSNTNVQDVESSYKLSAGLTLEDGKVYFNTNNYTTLSNANNSNSSPIITAISSNGNAVTTVDNTDGTKYTTINTNTGQIITVTKNQDGTVTTEITDSATGKTQSLTTRPNNIEDNTNLVLTTDSNGNSVLSNPENVVNPVIGSTITTIAEPVITIGSDSQLNAIDNNLTDTPNVNCAENGISLGTFLNATINNSINK